MPKFRPFGFSSPKGDVLTPLARSPPILALAGPHDQTADQGTERKKEKSDLIKCEIGPKQRVAGVEGV